MRLTKTNSPGLLKDQETRMVVAADDGEYRRILARRKAMKEEQDLRIRVSRLEAQVAELLSRCQ